MTVHTIVNHRLSRRAVIRATSGGVAGAAVNLASPGPLLAAGFRQSPAAATPDGAESLAGTPLGEQLAWFIDAVNSGGTSLTVAEIEEHLAPSILTNLPPEQAIATVQGLAAGFGSLTLEGVTRPPTTTQAVALATAGEGFSVAVPIKVEDATPFRITGLNVYPVPTATGEPLLPLPTSDMDDPSLGSLVDVGGRALYASDTGTDGPTVVLESGLGDPAAPWSGLIPGIASFARVVSYDRPNTEASASDPAPTPRTGADVVADLYALLEGAAIPGPYVLVGHSIGGTFVRLYASLYPDDVAGLVLVDATHEDQFTRLEDMVPPELLEMVTQGDNAEGIDVETSLAQVAEARATTPLQPMPLIVLSAGQSDPAIFPEGWPLEETDLLHLELQEDLASLVPGARLIVAEQSTHYIHQTQPDLVLDAIRQVVDAVRDPGTWATPPAATPAT
jgi:pimeloyl-ACP methyl ester carboxylesterase